MNVDRKRAAEAIDSFLRAIGRDPSVDPELHETGARVADAFVDELCGGYAVDAIALLRRHVIAGHTGVVVVRGIAVQSMCPHHLLPSAGVASVAFAPADKLVGLGTVVRVVDAFARRLALQEAIGEQVVQAIGAELGPRWAACRLVLSHSCMTARNERSSGSQVETVAVWPPGLTDAEALLALTTVRGGA